MSILQNTENGTFAAYREAVECFEQMSSMFEMPHQLIDETAKRRLLETCFQKLQTLIYIEWNILSGDDFYSDICTSLVLLREQVIQLTNPVQNSIFTKPRFNTVISSRTSVQPVHWKSNTVQSAQSSENDRLKQTIESTQVVPRVQGLSDIAGHANIKKTLTAVVILPMKQPQLYVGQKICNSILLYGPPGTGKTQLAHALAAESSAHLFSVTSSDILSQYVGQTEKMVRALFQAVKQTRDNCTILFMDEIDGLCKQRSDNDQEWTRRLKAELMCQLSNFEDCHNIFLICATNCPWDLDPAFLRRFQQRIYVPLPDRQERFELLKLFTKDMSLEIPPSFWDPLLNKTEGYSGSDLADLVRYAVNTPLTELIGTKQWEPIANNMYKPATGSPGFFTKCCELNEMPVCSIQARPVQIGDLMTAADVVNRTVCSANLQKYEKFTNKS